MSDRIDELAERAADALGILDAHIPPVPISTPHAECPKCAGHDLTNIVIELATIARENAREADKWRMVAEWLANQLVTAKVRWPVLVGAWSLPPRAEDVWIEAALAAVEQEEAE